MVPGAQGWLSHGSGSKDLELPERPGITAPRSLLLSPLPRFLARCLPLQSQRLRRGRGTRQPKPWAVSGQQAPCSSGRETFTGPGTLLHNPLSPARPAPAVSPPRPRDRSFLSRSGGRSRLGEGCGGLYRTQPLAKRLRLSRSRPPLPEASHLSGGGGWGAARPCSGGGSSCFSHHREDARAGTASSL